MAFITIVEMAMTCTSSITLAANTVLTASPALLCPTCRTCPQSSTIISGDDHLLCLPLRCSVGVDLLPSNQVPDATSKTKIPYSLHYLSCSAALSRSSSCLPLSPTVVRTCSVHVSVTPLLSNCFGCIPHRHPNIATRTRKT